MEFLIQKVKDAELDEVRKTIEAYGLFHSDHEAASVLREEIEEATEDAISVQEGYQTVWKAVRKDAKVPDEDLLSIRDKAIHGAAELIQVAAMAEKFKTSAGFREKREHELQDRMKQVSEEG